MVLTTLILFTLVYGALMVADIYLMSKFAKAGPHRLEPAQAGLSEWE
jgi:cytochrome d ubiquinol oxidase subunit I